MICEKRTCCGRSTQGPTRWAASARLSTADRHRPRVPARWSRWRNLRESDTRPVGREGRSIPGLNRIREPHGLAGWKQLHIDIAQPRELGLGARADERHHAAIGRQARVHQRVREVRQLPPFRWRRNRSIVGTQRSPAHDGQQGHTPAMPAATMMPRRRDHDAPSCDWSAAAVAPVVYGVMRFKSARTSAAD